jgi:hypothetical protein
MFLKKGVNQNNNLSILLKNTVLCPFLYRYYYTIPLPSLGVPLPQSDLSFLKKGSCSKASHSILNTSVE